MGTRSRRPCALSAEAATHSLRPSEGCGRSSAELAALALAASSASAWNADYCVANSNRSLLGNVAAMAPKKHRIIATVACSG